MQNTDASDLTSSFENPSMICMKSKLYVASRTFSFLKCFGGKIKRDSYSGLSVDHWDVVEALHWNIKASSDNMDPRFFGLGS